MKKQFFTIIGLYILFNFSVIFAQENTIVPSEEYPVPHTVYSTEFADYSLIPQCDFSKKNLPVTDYPVNLCYQDFSRISKKHRTQTAKEPVEIMNHLEWMGGEVRYFDIPKQKFIPIFKECYFNKKKNELVIKDKNFGKMHCTTQLQQQDTSCSVKAVLCRPLMNPLFWEIKKNEFSIYVLTNETEEYIDLYICIQSSYKVNKLLASRIDNAFHARINGMQDWFVREYLGRM